MAEESKWAKQKKGKRNWPMSRVCRLKRISKNRAQTRDKHVKQKIKKLTKK